MPVQKFTSQNSEDKSFPKTHYSLLITRNFRGFTLIELMIAISIVAIVAAIGLTSYAQAQKLARDAKRKQDLRSIAIALELYRNSQTPKAFPSSEDWVYSTGSQPWVDELNQTFINQMPIDPINTGSNPWSADGGHVYAYCSDSANCSSSCDLDYPWYILVAKLENASDKDTIAKQNIYWCDGELLRNKGGWDPNTTFALTSE